MPIDPVSLFTRIAPRYDLANRVLSLGLDRRWRRAAIGLLPPGGGLALDLACGTHDMGRLLLGHGRAGRVLGIDATPAMLRAGRHRQTVRLHTVAADAARLPLASAIADTVVIAFGWRNVADAATCLTEMRRVLKPGGSLLILDFFRPQRRLARCFHQRIAPLMLPRVGGLITGAPASYAYLVHSIARFLTVNEAVALLDDNGFVAQRHLPLLGGIADALCATRSSPSRAATVGPDTG